jgi:energy-coupling factor transporter ATP-binding protein EcfA2
MASQKKLGIGQPKERLGSIFQPGIEQCPIPLGRRVHRVASRESGLGRGDRLDEFRNMTTLVGLYCGDAFSHRKSGRHSRCRAIRFPWKSLISNVEFGLKMRGVNKAERQEIAKEMLARIGLSEFCRHYPCELSGGMQQRVNLARVLVNRPEVLLMDEPFGALDAQTRLQMQEMLLELWEEYRMTVVFITHDVDEAILLSDRVLIMSRRPGKITAEIPVSLNRPRTLELSTSADFQKIKRECLAYVRPESSRSPAAQNTSRASIALEGKKAFECNEAPRLR